MHQKLFLTGPPRSGKTSLLQQCLNQAGLKPTGFAVQRLTSDGCTWAFRLLDLSREPWVSKLETTHPFPDIAICLKDDGHWLGLSGIFDTKGVAALEHPLQTTNSLVIMDELGIFERDALRFQKAVFQVLDSKLPVLGVIKPKSALFLDRVRAHPQIRIIDLAARQAAAELEAYLEAVK